MATNPQSNPNGYIGHEAAEARIAANMEEVRAQREAREHELGFSGSDGVVLDAFSRFGGRALRDGGALDQMAQGAFGDLDGEIGGAIAGIGDATGRAIGRIRGGGDSGHMPFHP
jgi:hypothetical protein